MSVTPTRAFRDWLNHMNREGRRDATGFGPRKIARLYSGKERLSPQRLHALADECADPATAATLRAAADQESTDA